MSSSSKNSLKRFFPPIEQSNKKRGKRNISQENQELSSSESDTEQATITNKSKRSHERKEPDQSWFKFYPWLDQQEIDGKITLFCSLCKERKGKLYSPQVQQNID